jgi:hypothetical protein
MLVLRCRVNVRVIFLEEKIASYEARNTVISKTGLKTGPAKGYLITCCNKEVEIFSFSYYFILYLVHCPVGSITLHLVILSDRHSEPYLLWIWDEPLSHCTDLRKRNYNSRPQFCSTILTAYFRNVILVH